MVRSLFFLFLVVVLISGCSSSIPLMSVRSSSLLAIEPPTVPLTGAAVHEDEKHRFTLEAAHDSTAIVVRLTVHDRSLAMRLLRSGMTVWFDGAGGKDKTFGITYPLPLAPEPRSGSDRPEPGESRDPMLRAIQQQMELDVVGKQDYDRTRMPVFGAEGIGVKLTAAENGGFVYLLRVPLHRGPGHTYAIEPAPGSPIGIGLVQEERKRPMDQGDHRGEGMGMPGGDEGRGMAEGGEREGGMRGRRGGGRPGGDEMPGRGNRDALTAWFTFSMMQQ